MNNSIDFNPPRKHFNYLMEALDKYKFNNNFLSPTDRKFIYESFSNKSFIAMYHEGVPIGFTTWEHDMQSAIVGYKWIIPDYRRRGLGKLFAKLTYDEFLSRDIFIVYVTPATENGWGLSNSFGFKPLADTDYHYSTSYQYLFLRNGRASSSLKNSRYELLIWHDYNHMLEPGQVYNIDETMNESPILTIIDGESHVELRLDGKILISTICKRFFTETEFQNNGLLYFNTNLSDLLKRFNVKV